MNIGQGQAHESYFGPPSELFKVSDFLSATNGHQTQFSDNAEDLGASTTHLDDLSVGWLSNSEELRHEVEAECSVSDLHRQLHDVISNPRLMAHTMQSHEVFVQSVHETADTSNRRKRKRTAVSEPDHEHPEIMTLRTSLDSVQLQCWPLTIHSALFIRPPKHADHNTLLQTKSLSFGSTTGDKHQALLFVTIYNPLTWGHRLLARASQHVLLSSQSLGDLVDTIPCVSNEIPDEHTAEVEGNMPRSSSSAGGSTGSVICVEDIAYGDGQSEQDYSDKLVELLTSSNTKPAPTIAKGPAMHDTVLSTLNIRLHKPYWMLHAGNCDHFIVFEHVRLWHSSDPGLSKYPLTTQITPPLLDTCRACSKAPAVYAICGDVRLGESPFVICAPCWRWMGEPRGEDTGKINVVPLPKYEHGWGGTSIKQG